jgi:pimeloyl-ACP methyl ester carboxylesterase
LKALVGLLGQVGIIVKEVGRLIMGLQARFVETQHARVAISETDGTGHPVLLIHGNSSCRQVFRHQLEGELGNRYRMIAMDLPGHGDSENARDPQESYTQPAYAEAAVDVLRACGAENAVILGWSLGGHIGIELISRLPDMRALTFSGTPPTGPGTEEVSRAFTPLPHMAFTSKELFSQEDAETYAKYTCGVDLPPDPVLSAAVKRTDGKARRIMWDRWTIEGLGCPQRRTVETWDRPIAVIQGSDEAFFDNAYLDGINWRNLWSEKVHIIDGGGHAPFWAKSDLYNGILASFLADVTN